MGDKETFTDTGMVSAVTGGPVDGLLYEPRRQTVSRLSAVGFYSLVALVLWWLPAAVPRVATVPELKLPNLVFIAEPGSGGGGGGGGEQSPEPPSVQKLAGEDQARLALSMEMPEEELVYEEEDPPEPPEEEPEKEDEADEVKAPVMAQAPDELDQKGLLEVPEQLLESAGPGEARGSGTGNGGGIGEGDGRGIGPGHGGGFGGGAYRIGSGVEPPVLRRQIRPDYTDYALSRKIQGTVLLEIIILKDGTVGPVRILHSLEPSLDEKAVEAVRQFLFLPGRFRGEPVDVVAEIAVDFSLL